MTCRECSSETSKGKKKKKRTKGRCLGHVAGHMIGKTRGATGHASRRQLGHATKRSVVLQHGNSFSLSFLGGGKKRTENREAEGGASRNFWGTRGGESPRHLPARTSPRVRETTGASDVASAIFLRMIRPRGPPLWVQKNRWGRLKGKESRFRF